VFELGAGEEDCAGAVEVADDAAEAGPVEAALEETAADVENAVDDTLGTLGLGVAPLLPSPVVVMGERVYVPLGLPPAAFVTPC